jgi:hypothetical protein
MLLLKRDSPNLSIHHYQQNHTCGLYGTYTVSILQRQEHAIDFIVSQNQYFDAF